MSSSATQEAHARAQVWLRSRATHVWLIVSALTIVWFSLAAGRPLSHPDEGRYAEIPREMLVSGDWITPHLNDLAYLEKPPLQYWATALTYQLLGPGEWTARLWTMLSGWLNVLLVFLLGRRLWNFRTGVIAAAMLASTLLHFFMGQLLTLDMAFTFLLTAMLCAFCMAQVERETPRRSGRWMLASWALLALAILTKGIVAIVIGGAVLAIYMVWQRDWAMLRTLRVVPGLIVLAVVAGPWFMLVSRANSDFLSFFFLHEHFQRYLTESARRVEPWWYFAAILVAGVLPWLPQMLRALFTGWRSGTARGQFDVQRLLWVWSLFVLVFFSLSGSKLAPYILPMFPTLALLTAARIAPDPARHLSFSVWTLLLFAGACAAYVVLEVSRSSDPYVRSLAHSAQIAVLGFGIIAAVTAFISRRARASGEPVYALIGVAVGWFLGLAVLFATVGHESELRSARDLAARIPAELAARGPIYSVRNYDQSLPFYLARTMVLVDVRGSELEYGLRHEPEKEIRDMATFERTWRAAPDAVAILPHDVHEQLQARGLPMRVLGTDRDIVAVSRQ